MQANVQPVDNPFVIDFHKTIEHLKNVGHNEGIDSRKIIEEFKNANFPWLKVPFVDPADSTQIGSPPVTQLKHSRSDAAWTPLRSKLGASVILPLVLRHVKVIRHTHPWYDYSHTFRHLLAERLSCPVRLPKHATYRSFYALLLERTAAWFPELPASIAHGDSAYQASGVLVEVKGRMLIEFAGNELEISERNWKTMSKPLLKQGGVRVRFEFEVEVCGDNGVGEVDSATDSDPGETVSGSLASNEETVRNDSLQGKWEWALKGRKVWR